MTVKGSCLCGAVEYEFGGEINELAICHCDQCKRAQGTAFAVNAPVNIENFRFISGENSLTAFFSSKNKKRVFCSNCGSPIFSQRTNKPDIIRLRVGTITCGLDQTPDYEQYCQFKASWSELKSGIPNYPGAKPCP